MHNISNLEIHVRVVYSSGHLRNGIVWFQKISILPPPPPPWKNIGNSEGEGGKGRNFQGVGGGLGKVLFQRVKNHIQNIESNLRSETPGGRGEGY